MNKVVSVARTKSRAALCHGQRRLDNKDNESCGTLRQTQRRLDGEDNELYGALLQTQPRSPGILIVEVQTFIVVL
jgi:hypothetical protein